MKKLILKTLLLALIIFTPCVSIAGVSVHVNVPLPPPIIFPAPPSLIVIPETNVYAVPDIHDDIFFYSGWWWRPWQGRWYRSRYYDRGWAFYPNPPYFYQNIPPGWRQDYRNRHWKGYRWDHKPIPHYQLQRNWNKWKQDRYWEDRRWGVRGYHKRPAQKYYDARTPQPKPKPQPEYRHGYPR